MKPRRIATYAAVGGVAAVIGVAAGVAGGAAAPKRPTAGRTLARAVHAELVVPARGRFATVTYDRGRVKSVDGDRLTLLEGTAKTTYRTVETTIPAAAIVRNDGSAASLSSIRPGEIARVVEGPRRTRVLARHVRRR